MSNWEIFRHDHAIGVRMPSDNKTKYGAVRYVTIGGFDSEDPEQMAEVERIVQMIADAPALLEALEALLMGRHYFSAEEGNNRFCKVCGQYFTDAAHYRDGESRNTDEGKARALIAKHGGES